ncbi:MAG: ABC transporter ATP-binding protein/permease [Azospirillaceae bacterium]
MTVASQPPDSRWERFLEIGRTIGPFFWPKGDLGIKSRVVMALGFLVLAKVANVYVPVIFRDAVDALNDSSGAAVAVPVGLIAAYGFGKLLTVAFQQFREVLFVTVARGALRDIALKAFEHLHRLGARFHVNRKIGALAQNIDRGVNGVRQILEYLLFNLFPTMLELVLTCAVLWAVLDFKIAAVTALTIVAYIVFSITITEWRMRFRREMNRDESASKSVAMDSLINVETVKAFNAERHEAERYGTALTTFVRSSIKSVLSLALVNVGQGAIIGGGIIILLWMAADGVANGTMTIGEFTMINAYLLQLFQPLNMLGFVYRQIRNGFTDLEDLIKLLREAPEVADQPDAATLAVPRGEVRFEGVGFHYDAERRILKDIDLTIRPGGTVAVVGPTGSGKTTLSRLLMRYYDVTEGRITIDGQEVREVTQESLRDAIGIVPQDTVLFNDTIAYNIAYGRRDASREEIEEAARVAQLDGFIASLPQGYDSVVGERGLKLSGGEKQRVAIARLALKKPRILIFDEATSSLDTVTERRIMADLEALAEGRSTLVIAHRLSTVMSADEIVVLDKGEIVERGRHAELLARGGAYAAMWQEQQEQKEETDDTAGTDPSKGDG